MLIVSPGSEIEIPFVYKSGFSYLDPTEDIYVYLKRGYGTPGSIISGPFKYDMSLISGASPSLTQQLGSSIIVERISQGSYNLKMTIPQNLFEGIYTVQISTTADGLSNLKETFIQCLKTAETNQEEFSPEDKQIQIRNRSKYQNLSSVDMNSIMLIGHTDGIDPFSIHKVSSIQEGINILRADFESPLLRGLFDAYASGARNIYIMSAGYMSEYVSDVELRNIKKFADSGATPNEFSNSYSFYELYYMKLELCYEILRDYEFIDIIVPLESSMVDTGTMNFVSQLASHCDLVQRTTGEVQIGIIGSRTIEGTAQNILDLENKDFEIPTTITEDGSIEQDAGKYIILIYGEAIFNHKQMQRSYSGSVATSFAATLASTRVDYGLVKKRIPTALSIFGPSITSAQLKKLTDNKINAIVSGNRSRRNSIYDVSLTGDLTQSVSENFSDSSNVRLVAMIINEVQSMGINALGKFAHDRLIRNVDALLGMLKSADIVRDYTFDAYADRLIRGKLYFNISVVSVRTLRSISFNVATGKGV